MLGMLIAIGNRPNRVAADGVVGLVEAAGVLVRGVDRDVRVVIGVIRPAVAAVGCGGGVVRFAYPMTNAVVPPTARMIAKMVAAVRGDHPLAKLRML